MNRKVLTNYLAEIFQQPVKGMGNFKLGKFSEFVPAFGTTDLKSLPSIPAYVSLINNGLILGYKEPRMYNSEDYGYHWGIDIMSPEGTPVFAADDGIVLETVVISDISDDYSGTTYGNCIVLQNQYNENIVYTLYGHLANLEDRFCNGQAIKKGEQLGIMGKGFTVENGGWPPHLHFQVGLSFMGLLAYAGLELEKETLNPLEIFKIN